MFKVIFWTLLDFLFIRMLVSEYKGLGAYNILILAFIALFTWELYCSVKKLLE